MSTVQVNNIPGADYTGQVGPQDYVHAGLRSGSLKVQPGSINMLVAPTSLQLNPDHAPTGDAALATKATAAFVAPEREDATPNATITAAGYLQIQKSVLGTTENSVFEISRVLGHSRPVMAFVQLHVNHSWGVGSPGWCSLGNMAAPYMALEYGPLNTALYVFLRNVAGVGSLVVGGPQPTAGAARGGQATIAYDWVSLIPDGDTLNLIFWIDAGNDAWKLQAVSAAGVTTDITTGYLSTLGTFPSTGANRRVSTSDQARLIIGSGYKTDAVKFADWALFSDVRSVFEAGRPGVEAETVLRPNSPLTFEPWRGILPGDVESPWFTAGTLTVSLETEANSADPGILSLEKLSLTDSGSLWRGEPDLSGGFTFEMSATLVSSAQDGDTTGCGVYAEPTTGKAVFLAFLLVSGTRKIGLWKGGGIGVSRTDSANYYLADVDWSVRRNYAVTYDTLRDKVTVFVDSAPVITKTISSDLGTPLATGARVYVGFPEVGATAGSLSVYALRLATGSKAWDAVDAALPSSGGLFNLVWGGSATTNMVGGKAKLVTGPTGGYAFYSKAVSFDSAGGFRVDATVAVPAATDSHGVAFPPNANTGVGIRVYTGTQVVRVGLYDCGVHGRKIGVVPGSGSEQDILNQTELGRAFSAPWDWTAEVHIRVELVMYDAVRIWVGSVDSPNPVLITFPWIGSTDSFDLPSDVTSPALEFGHLDPGPTSTSDWGRVEWAVSRGYDISARPVYSGILDHLFGGKIFVLTEFTEA